MDRRRFVKLASAAAVAPMLPALPAAPVQKALPVGVPVVRFGSVYVTAIAYDVNGTKVGEVARTYDSLQQYYGDPWDLVEGLKAEPCKTPEHYEG